MSEARERDLAEEAVAEPEAISRGETIARELRRDILRGRYRPGDRLPSERELAARTSTHRGAAREALKLLEHQRLIQILPGGARVAPIEEASLDVLSHLLEVRGTRDPALIAQCLDVQEIFLTGAVRLAVERARAPERAHAELLLRRLSRGGEEGDHGYHRDLEELVELMARASRNLALQMLRNGLKALFGGLLPPGRSLPKPPPSVLRPAADALAEALAARDAAAAEEAVRSLLRANRERLLKSLEATREART